MVMSFPPSARRSAAVVVGQYYTIRRTSLPALQARGRDSSEPARGLRRGAPGATPRPPVRLPQRPLARLAPRLAKGKAAQRRQGGCSCAARARRRPPHRLMLPELIMKRGPTEEARSAQERLLDHALEETFPASDPIAMQQIVIVGRFQEPSGVLLQRGKSPPKGP